MSDIPEELKLQILVRLPTKSLLRFRCFNVKEIYTVIEKCRSSALRPFRKTIGELDFPFDKPQGEYYTVVGCIDGLICLWDDTHELNPVTLWNPAIRKSYQVPHLYCKPSDSTSRTYLKCSFGFGFDALANDYKILRIAFWFRNFQSSRRVDSRPLSFSTKPVLCSADIFSLSTKSWRCVSFSMPLQQLSVPVFVNGALHFLTRKDGTQCCIVSFSLNAETFVEMACPQGGKLNTNLNHQIAGSPETIFLFHQLPGNHYDIWVMKEYNVEESWTKLYSIHLDNGEEKRLISVRRNGKFISCGEGAGHSEFYSESLVLLGDDNCVTHLQQEEECRGEERCTCLRINELNLRSIKRDINQREA